MTSGPVMVQALEGENAILRHRELMGATNPAEAAPGTIRADFLLIQSMQMQCMAQILLKQLRLR